MENLNKLLKSNEFKRNNSCLFSYNLNKNFFTIGDIKIFLKKFINDGLLPTIYKNDNNEFEIEFKKVKNKCKEDFFSFLADYISNNIKQLNNDAEFLMLLCDIFDADKDIIDTFYDLLVEFGYFAKNNNNLDEFKMVLNYCKSNENFSKKIKILINKILNDENNFELHSSDIELIKIFIELFGKELNKSMIKKIVEKLTLHVNEIMNYYEDMSDIDMKKFSNIFEIFQLINEKTKYNVCDLDLKKAEYSNIVLMLNLVFGNKCPSNSNIFKLNNWQNASMSIDFAFYLVKLIFKNYNVNDKNVLNLLEFLFVNFIIDNGDFELLFEFSNDEKILADIFVLMIKNKKIDCKQYIDKIEEVEELTKIDIKIYCPDYMIDSLFSI
jgi:hypothetical protein